MKKLALIVFVGLGALIALYIFLSLSIFVMGVVLTIVSICLAFVANYYLKIRRTTSGGVIEVDGFKGYIIHLLSSFIVGILLNGLVILGIGMIIYGLVVG